MENNKFLIYLQEAGILILTAAVGSGASVLYGNTQLETVRILVLMLAAAGCVVFAMEESREQNGFLFDNGKNTWRFFVLYLLFLLGSAMFPMLPAGGWPFLAVFTALMLFGNQLVAVCAGSTLLMLTLLLGKIYSLEEFVIYFVIGMTGVLVFSYLDETFKVGLPMMISLLVQMVCLCIHEVLMVNETLHPEMLLIPMVNTLVCLILLLIILKFFSFSILHKNRDLYMDINDPECPLLVELKNFSKEEYYHAIHTAYLCDRIAKRLGADDSAAKAGGYYHKIGVLKGQSSWENTQAVLEEYHFPEKVHTVLKEYLDKDERIVSKETVILLFSDTVISSISYFFAKDPKVQLDYEKMIQAVFKKKTESGLINYSQISMCELEEMKKILTEEKLYYDFLR